MKGLSTGKTRTIIYRILLLACYLLSPRVSRAFRVETDADIRSPMIAKGSMRQLHIHLQGACMHMQGQFCNTTPTTRWFFNRLDGCGDRSLLKTQVCGSADIWKVHREPTGQARDNVFCSGGLVLVGE